MEKFNLRAGQELASLKCLGTFLEEKRTPTSANVIVFDLFE